MHRGSAAGFGTPADQRRDLVERAGDGPDRPRRHSGVQGGVVELGMPKQRLDDADIDPILIRLAYPRRLPTVLSPEEVARLLAATTKEPSCSNKAARPPAQSMCVIRTETTPPPRAPIPR